MKITLPVLGQLLGALCLAIGGVAILVLGDNTAAGLILLGFAALNVVLVLVGQYLNHRMARRLAADPYASMKPEHAELARELAAARASR